MPNTVLTDDEQEAIDQGEAAGLLLDNPMFLKVVEAVRAQCAEAILTSPPEALKAREDAYHLSRGLSAITVELSALAARGEQVLAETEARTETDDQDDPVVKPHDY